MELSRLPGFLLRRGMKAAVVILAIVVCNFFLIHAAPGDPASVIAGQSGAADERFLAQLREQFGLDKPLHVQLWIYLKGVLTLDLGFSHRQQQPVWGLIAERLPATLLLTGAAFAFAVAAGVTLGTLAARRVGRWADSVITVIALTFYGVELSGIDAVLDVGKHLILPAATLGLFYLAVYARLTRATMLEVADQDFVKTARAKGVPEGQVVRRHVLRNALLPVITFAGIQAGQLVGGSILVETVFAWPGIGRLAFDALLARDYAVLLGVFFCTSVMVVLFNLVTDLLYAVVDPRVEVEG